MKRDDRSERVENSSADSPETNSSADAGMISRGAIWPAAAVIVLAAAAAFGPSFAGCFLLDDHAAILKNTTIQRLWPAWQALCPPNNGETVTGRPLLNLSLAVNYAVSGYDVWSYHVANLAIHILGALLLFGILRRTFLLPTMSDRWGEAATALALSIALLWAIHPLQTESVTYIVQRAESLVGFFYLLTLYCFLRSVGSARAVYWHVGSVLACLLGMASKEVMVSAPLIVLLYDWTFCAGSFREAWRRRYGLYLGLAGTWLLLGWLVVSTGGRGGSAGLGTPIGSWDYLCTQFGAIVGYLRLSLWPHPLVFDYGVGTAQSPSEIVPYAILIGLLGAATVVALWRWPKVGFLGAWFLAILAPTSSVIPVATQTIAEHRMYLPLAAVATGVVLGGYAVGQWIVGRGRISRSASRIAGCCALTFAIVALGIATFRRNMDYRSDLLMWEDTVAKVPASARAHGSLGNAFITRGKAEDAVAEYEKTVALEPDSATAWNNLGAALTECGRLDEAVNRIERALKIRPDYADAHVNLGMTLTECGRTEEAIAHLNEALAIDPDLAGAHYNLGRALRRGGQIDEAMTHYRRALEINPNYGEAHNNFGVLLAGSGQMDEAIAHFRKALEINPRHANARLNLADALAAQTRFEEAIAEYGKALEIVPDRADAHDRFGRLLCRIGRVDKAIAHYQRALELATAQGKQPLAESIKAEILFYEGHTLFHETRQPSPAGSAQP